MKSLNFEILRDGWPELAGLGGFAESYAHADPASALVKLRLFGENLTKDIYRELGLPKPDLPTFVDLLKNDAFIAITPKVTGAAMTPSSTKKGARRYRYYVSMDVIKNREPSDAGIPRRLPADLVEAAVVTELRRVMRAPSITAQVIAHLAREGHAFAEADVISALQTFEDVWGQLFPAEQTRIVQLLVRRVTVTSEGLVIDVRTDGVSGVMRDMMAPRKKVAAE